MKDEDFPLTLFTQILCLKIYKKLIDSKALIFGFNLGGWGELSQTFAICIWIFLSKARNVLEKQTPYPFIRIFEGNKVEFLILVRFVCALLCAAFYKLYFLGCVRHVIWKPDAFNILLKL